MTLTSAIGSLLTYIECNITRLRFFIPNLKVVPILLNQSCNVLTLAIRHPPLAPPVKGEPACLYTQLTKSAHHDSLLLSEYFRTFASYSCTRLLQSSCLAILTISAALPDPATSPQSLVISGCIIEPAPVTSISDDGGARFSPLRIELHHYFRYLTYIFTICSITCIFNSL